MLETVLAKEPFEGSKASASLGLRYSRTRLPATIGKTRRRMNTLPLALPQPGGKVQRFRCQLRIEEVVCNVAFAIDGAATQDGLERESALLEDTCRRGIRRKYMRF